VHCVVKGGEVVHRATPVDLLRPAR
jgi:hypothetical protein